ncbi:DUF262 domain-containing protein [Dyadobacter jiangsuensis]
MSSEYSNIISNRNFKSLFQSQARYEIPFFQRGYAWEKPQWDKLLEDLDNEVLAQIEDGDYDNQEHFFGPVVVLEKMGGHHSLKRFLVIDGQQRITTIYLMLGLIMRLMQEKQALSPEASGYIYQLQNLIFNNVDDADEYFRIKVFSTKGDRYPTFLALLGRNPQSPKLQEDQQLYVPAQNHVDQLVKYLRKTWKNRSVPELWQLSQALLRSLKIVWIPLDGAKDDAQAIFESLNAAGLPLSASELLCNYLFRPLTNEQTNAHEKLHNEKWLTAQHAITEEGGNFEDYLRNLLSIGSSKMVGHGRRLYVFFKTKNRALTREIALARLDEIHSNTKYYNQVLRPAKYLSDKADLSNLLARINETNMDSARPFLMAVLRGLDAGTMTATDVRVLIRETYVLLVRRKLTGLPTTKYDVLFPSLINRIASEPDKIRAFQKAIQEESVYVSDQELEDALIHRELYKPRELGFSRLILQEIDRQMQPHGEYPDYSTIPTIEHVLPQTPDIQWKEYLGHEALSPDLGRLTNTLGNLCLNSASANSSFGRQLYQQKQERYLNHQSALNRDIVSRKEAWTLGEIQKRSKDLAQVAIKVWKWADSQT